jgi:hypothetical protein
MRVRIGTQQPHPQDAHMCLIRRTYLCAEKLQVRFARGKRKSVPWPTRNEISSAACLSTIGLETLRQGETGLPRLFARLRICQGRPQADQKSPERAKKRAQAEADGYVSQFHY